MQGLSRGHRAGYQNPEGQENSNPRIAGITIEPFGQCISSNEIRIERDTGKVVDALVNHPRRGMPVPQLL